MTPDKFCCHLSLHFIDQLLRTCVLVQDNINLCCNCLIALAELIDASLYLLVSLPAISALQYCQKAAILFEAHFEELGGLFPALALVEDALVGDAIGDDDYAAAWPVFADDA